MVGLVVPCACGGGGGGGDGGDFTFEDIVGDWQGPTASVTVDGISGLAAGTTGLSIDSNGDAVGTGASVREGTVALVSASDGIYEFVGSGVSAGTTSLLVMSPDRDHLLWADSGDVLGAWERDATNFQGPYSDSEIRNETWTGTVISASSSMSLVASDPLVAVIDGAGSFTAGPASTNTEPLSITDTIKGAYEGDFIESGSSPQIGRTMVLLTPDREFIAVLLFLAGGTFPQDCAFAALSR